MSRDSSRASIDAVELVAELLGPELGVGPAAELADDEPALVADARRVDVLVAPLDLGHGRAVDAALVGERRAADVGLVVVGRDVGDLGHAPRRARSGRPGRRRRPARGRASVLSARLARMLTMLALPQRSP